MIELPGWLAPRLSSAPSIQSWNKEFRMVSSRRSKHRLGSEQGLRRWIHEAEGQEVFDLSPQHRKLTRASPGGQPHQARKHRENSQKRSKNTT